MGVDTHGDYIISCAVGDSKVLIRGLVSDEYNQVGQQVTFNMH